MNICMYVCMYACMRVCMYECLSVCMDPGALCMYVCLSVRPSVCLHACTERTAERNIRRAILLACGVTGGGTFSSKKQRNFFQKAFRSVDVPGCNGQLKLVLLRVLGAAGRSRFPRYTPDPQRINRNRCNANNTNVTNLISRAALVSCKVLLQGAGLIFPPSIHISGRLQF